MIKNKENKNTMLSTGSKYIIGVTILSCILISCNGYLGQTYMECKEVKFIDKFPHSVQLKDSIPLNIDLMGCVDFFIADSLLILKVDNNEYFWNVYSLSSNRHKVNLFRKGLGPNEYASLTCDEYVFSNDSSLLCNVRFSDTEELYSLDLSESMKCGKEIMQKKDIQLDKGMKSVLQVEDSTFFLMRYAGMGFCREMQVGMNVVSLGHLDAINNQTVRNDLNTLSGTLCFNTMRKRVAESMLRLNQINLYSWADDFNMTLSVGDHLTNVEMVDRTSKRELVKYYGASFAGDKYFAVLYYKSSYKNFFSGEGKSDIQFFSWDGEPLLVVSIPYMASSLYITDDRELYVLSTNEKTEMLCKYDIGDYLQPLLSGLYQNEL